MSIFDGLINTIGNLAPAVQAGASIWNTIQQGETQKYQKEVQQKAWDREDTAVQRRTKDLIAAGLSPTLAAGSAAQSSSPISVSTPQSDLGSVGPTAIALMRAKQDISRTAAEEAAIKLQMEKTKQDILGQELKNQVMLHDWSIIKDSGLRSDVNSWATQATELINAFGALLKGKGPTGALGGALTGLLGKTSDSVVTNVQAPATALPGAIKTPSGGYYLKAPEAKAPARRPR